MNSNLLMMMSTCSLAMPIPLLFPRIEDSKKIYDNIMKTYNRHIIPVEGTAPFGVLTLIQLNAVGEIDELDEKLSTVMQLTSLWIDKHIFWNSTETNVHLMTFGWEDVWKPVYIVENPYAEYSIQRDTTRSHDSVVYLSSGMASFEEILITRTTCDLDMTFYPFDVQTCYIKLRITGDSDFPIILYPSFVDYNISHSTVEHRTWTLLQKKVTPSGGNFEIALKFKRQPLFILLNILMPVLTVVFLTPIVFVLPKNSGDRVGFSMTMFLALSVYMTIVCKHLPQNSESISLVSFLLFIWYILDALIVSIVILNTRLYDTHNNKKIPFLFRRFVQLSGIIFLRRRKRVAEVGSEEERRALNASDDNEIGTIVHSHQPEERFLETWKDLSGFIDKWCFVLFYLLKIALPLMVLPVWTTKK